MIETEEWGWYIPHHGHIFGPFKSRDEAIADARRYFSAGSIATMLPTIVVGKTVFSVASESKIEAQQELNDFVDLNRERPYCSKRKQRQRIIKQEIEERRRTDPFMVLPRFRPVSERIPCPHCGRVFGSKQALLVHKSQWCSKPHR